MINKHLQREGQSEQAGYVHMRMSCLDLVVERRACEESSTILQRLGHMHE